MTTDHVMHGKKHRQPHARSVTLTHSIDVFSRVATTTLGACVTCVLLIATLATAFVFLRLRFHCGWSIYYILFISVVHFF